MKPDTISIVVPFHNASSTILKTLNSLENSFFQPLEIICVDDSSTDNCGQVLEQYAFSSLLKIILAKLPKGKRGAAAARNLGAKNAQGKYLLFLDSDVIVNICTIERLLSCIKKQACIAVIALFEDHSFQPGFLAHFQAFTVSTVYRALNPNDSPCFGTQCVLIEKEQFFRFGGFDESYNGASVEDFAFGYKLRGQGEVICIERTATIVHNHPYTKKSFLLNYFIKSRELFKLLVKYRHVKIIDTGYHDTSNVLTLLLLFTLTLLISLSCVSKEPAFWLSAIVSIILFSLIWKNYFFGVMQKYGLYTAVVFTCLRIIVILTGWGGLIIGLLIEMSNRKVTMQEWFAILVQRLIESLKSSDKNKI